MGGWRDAPAAPRGGVPGAAPRAATRSATWRDALQPLRDAAARRPPAPPGATHVAPSQSPPALR
jgi:hypothetical protein